MPPNSVHLPARWRAIAPRAALLLLLALAFVLLTGVLDGGVGVTPLRLFDQHATRWPMPGRACCWPASCWRSAGAHCCRSRWRSCCRGCCTRRTC